VPHLAFRPAGGYRLEVGVAATGFSEERS